MHSATIKIYNTQLPQTGYTINLMMAWKKRPIHVAVPKIGFVNRTVSYKIFSGCV